MKRLLTLLLLFLIILSCSKKPNQKQEKTTNIFYDKAFKFRDTLVIYDSAYYYFNKAKEMFLLQEDNFGAGKCLLNMGIIATDKGDYFGGQELSLNAIAYFDSTDKAQHLYIGSNFNNLGKASQKLKDYGDALKFYSEAIKFATNQPDFLLYSNNKAYIYQELKQYSKALTAYEEILSKKIEIPKEYARTLTNFSVTKNLNDPTYNPLPNLLEALKIRENKKDLLGQNSSYWTLADYYSKISKPDSAMYYAEKMFKVAEQIDNPDDQLLATEQLITSGPIQSTKRYFERYKKLSDSTQLIRNKAKNQFAVIRYDAEKHKAESLKFQKDSSEKTYQLIFLASGTVIIIGLGIFWYRKRKQRLQMEAENTIKENKLKTYKRVHDVLANGVYQLMTKVEHQKEIDKEHLLDEMEDLYEKTRNISYEKPVAANIDFHQKIAGLLHSFDSDRTLITVAGNTEDLWTQVSLESKDEVWHIIQELMVNMDKHSGADEVNLSFELKQQEVHVFYKDNGMGIKGAIKAGNGLQNVENRIHSINGQLTFETELEKGLQVHFSFPVS